MDGAGAAEPWEETCDIHDLLLWDPVCQPPLRAQCPPQRTNSPFVTHVQANMGLVYAQNAPTASQLPDGRSLGRDSQPPSGTHVATTRRSPLQSSSPAPSASAKSQPKRSVLCKNRGCNGLAVGRAANRQRNALCSACAKKQVVIINGAHRRFCQNCKNVHELGRFAGNNRSCERSLDRARSRGSTKGAVNIRTTHSDFVPPCIDRKEQNQQCQRHDGDMSNAERTPSAMPVATVPPICVGFDEHSPPATRGDEPSSGLSTVHAAATAAQQVDSPIPSPSDASMQLKFPKAVMHMIREASRQSDGSFLADLSRSLFGAEPFEFSVWMQETLLDWMMQIPLGLLTSHLSPASFSKLSTLFKKSARNWCSVLDDIDLPVSVFETRANQMKIKSVRPAVCVLTNCSRLRVALEGQGDLSGSEVHLYTSTSAGGDNTTSLPLSQLQPRPSVDVDTTQLNLPRLGSAIVQAVCPPRALYSQRETLVLTRDQMVQTELSDAVLVLRALEEHEKVQLCAFMYLIGCALASQVPETTCEKLREVMEWLGWSHTASKLQAICDQDTGHATPSNIIWQQHSDAPAPPSEPKLASDAPHIQPACIPIEEGNEQRLVDESATDAAPLGHPVMCNSFS